MSKIAELDTPLAKHIAQALTLSAATVTLDKLENRGLVLRTRSTTEKLILQRL